MEEEDKFKQCILGIDKLEDAALNYAKKTWGSYFDNTIPEHPEFSSTFGEITISDFVAGANWQKETMYNEQQMIEFSDWVCLNYPNQHNYLRALQRYNQGHRVPVEKFKGYRTTQELFEQFKKL